MGIDATPAVSAGDVMAALSLATDLGTDQPLEHGLRTAVLCARLAAATGCDELESADAFHLGLLHSIGCTSDAHEAAALYGEDLRYRSDFAEIDPGRPRELLGFLWRRTAESRAPHVASFAAAVAAGPRRARAGLTAHCEVAERFAARLELREEVRAALWHVFERWDGKGLPRGTKGEGIPRAARLLHLARDSDVHWRLGGDAGVRAMLAARSGSAYDPELAELALATLPEALAALEHEPVWEAVVAVRPTEARSPATRSMRRAGSSASSPTSSRCSRSGTRPRSPSSPRRRRGAWGSRRATSRPFAAPDSCTTSGASRSPPAPGSGGGR
jgi:HD domain